MNQTSLLTLDNKSIDDIVKRLGNVDLESLRLTCKSASNLNPPTRSYKDIEAALVSNVSVYTHTFGIMSASQSDFPRGYLNLHVKNDDGTSYVYEMFTSFDANLRYQKLNQEQTKKFDSSHTFAHEIIVGPKILMFFCLKALDDTNIMLQLNLAKDPTGNAMAPGNDEQQKALIENFKARMSDLLGDLTLQTAQLFYTLPPCNMSGGSAQSKVRILGRERKIIMQGRKAMVKVNGQMISLTEAKRLEKRKKF